MVHIKFDPNSISMSEFETQIGQGEYNYFRGSLPFQRGFGYYQSGAGVGDFLRTLWRAILPSIKSAGKVLGQEALSTSSRILDDVSQGENLKDSIQRETVKGVDNLLEKRGIKRQYGSGTIKTLKTHPYKIIPSKKNLKKISNLKNSSLISQLNSKKPLILKNYRPQRTRADAFGLY
jgi:hypothetical protein